MICEAEQVRPTCVLSRGIHARDETWENVTKILLPPPYRTKQTAEGVILSEDRRTWLGGV